ncbi:MAG: HAD family phosphatase [Eggerthellaceae bacterium]|nr:HAD family phosphatase [Eggerthellaceae bacterium]
MPDLGVIFDCDGTLIDSMAAWRELEASLARQAGAELTKADTDALTTMTIPECGAYLHEKFGLGTSGVDVEGMIDAFMLDFYANRAVARPGVMPFVEGLAAAGVPMAVASSTPKALLEAGLAHAGIAPYLRAIVSVDDVGKSKREPAVYNRAREALGTARAQTWGFEDALYAIRTLNAAGYRTFGIYDCDMSGTWVDLQAEADRAARSFTDVSAAEFLEWNADRASACHAQGEPHVRVVYKPVAPRASAGEGAQGCRGAGASSGVSDPALRNPYLRAENEDDDGYDPYSDRREEPPLFEENPWD